MSLNQQVLIVFGYVIFLPRKVKCLSKIDVIKLKNTNLGMLHLHFALFSPFKDWMQNMWQKNIQGLRF